MRIYTKAQGGWAQREFSKESNDLVKKSNDLVKKGNGLVKKVMI